jgi:hypothetical protein
MNKELYEQLIREKPYLWWWVKDKKNMSVESVVQGVLANGDMDDLFVLFKFIGREQVKQIFFQQISMPRHNYRKQFNTKSDSLG